ncbi:KAP family P-loop NTPase fold protein [Nonomuraea rubra]
MLSDAPVSWRRDLLQFRRYVDPLMSIITSQDTQTPFTIGVYGDWGSGKTTLLEMVDQRLAERHAEEFVRVHFNPWVHRREPEMLLPLLNALHNTVSADPKHRFTEMVKKLGVITMNLAADELLKKLNLGAVSVEKIGKLAQQYAEMRGQIDSQTGRLREALQEQADHLAKENRKIVFFVDDLDRCGPDQIIDLLESIKLFLDLRNVFVVIALSKDVVDRGVSVRYEAFKFPATVHIGDDYLDKMIQLPVHLYPLGPAEVGRFIRESGPGKLAQQHVAILEQTVTPNPRKIKRVLNLLRLTEAIIDATPRLADLHTDLIARLVVLRVQSPDLYAEVARLPTLLHAIELVHQHKLKYPPDWHDRFGEQADRLRELSDVYTTKYDFLALLFAKSAFAASADELSVYLTMIGG